MKVNLPAFERAGVMVVGDVMLIAIGMAPLAVFHRKRRCPWLR